MRVLLSTLAVMAVISPAIANDMNSNPEGSINQSSIVANEIVAAPVAKPAMKSVKAADMADMEPAAGIAAPATKFSKMEADMYSDPEGTNEPSRMVE